MKITATLLKNKITLLFFFTFFQLLAFNTQAQMRQVYLDNPSNNISRISFYSPSNGYASFTNWIGYTADSGRTFTKKFITLGNVNFGNYNVNTLFAFAINGVKAISQDTIVVYGDYGFEPSILYSSNGGNSYTLVYHVDLSINPPISGAVNDMVFPQNNAIGYAINANKILKTTNKGLSWSIILNDPNTIFGLLDGIDNNNLFAYSSNNTNKLFKSNNGGSTWQQITLPTGSIVFGDFITVNKGWVYMNNGTQYSFYYTANGGTTWSQKDNTAIPFGQMVKMQFTNDSTGYAIAGGFSTYKSTDSGKIWEPLPRDNNYSGTYNIGHYDIQCLNTTQLWAGGENGYLELSTNGGGVTLPKAYFKIDTAGVYNTNTVNLENSSKTTYQFQWSRNGALISTAYNAAYTADFFHPYDTIQLIVSNGINTDTLIKYQNLNLHPPTPIISSFTPTSGSIATSVTITGTNFSGSTVVSFGGTPASSFIVNSATSITAIVAGGSTGNVSITTQYGTGVLAGFIYNSPPPPVISSFTPTSGPAGTQITISGLNFNTVATNNIVYFGAAKATIISASTTQLIVQIPTGATYKPITALNTYTQLSGFSNKPFLVTFPGGGGSFTSTSFEDVLSFFPPSSLQSWRIATGDFNDDGKPDVVIAPNDGLKLTVYKNTSSIGAMSFLQSGDYLTESTGKKVKSIGIADIDGDGKLDIVATRDSNFNGISTVSIFRNTSTGTNISFAAKVDIAGSNEQYQLSLGDLDGDGRPEIAVSRNTGYNFSVFKNTSASGNISFSASLNFDPVGIGSYGIQIGDIDADNKPDILIAKLDSTFSIYKNTSAAGSINFAPKIDKKTAGKYPAHFYIGDLDGDDKADIIVSDTYENKFSTFRNTGTPGIISFASKVDFSIPNGSTGARNEIADLNGDGKLDFAIESGQLGFCNNLSTPGNISFALPVHYTASGYIVGDHCLADFDGDGKVDVSQMAWGGNGVHIYRNKFAGSLAYAGPDAGICLGNNIQLGVNTVTGNTYSWISNPAGFTSSISNPLVSPTVTTSYYLTVSNGTATASDTVIITVNPIPVANAGVDKNICPLANTSIGTTATSGNTYSWISNPVGFTSTNANPTVNPSATTNYYLTVTNSFGCIAKDTVIVNINIPVANAGTDQLLCPGNSTTIGIATTGDTYTWTSSPAGFVSSIANPSVSPAITTSYFLTVTNALGCFAKDTVTVTIDTPVANAGADKTTCSGNAVAIGTPPITGYTYSWSSNPVGFTSTVANPNVSPVLTTSYFLTASNGNCTAKDTVIVNVNSAILPAVSIAASSTNICTGNTVSFTATATNGGANPFYQWQVNGSNVGTNSTTFTSSSLNNNDQVKVILTSSLSCALPVNITSNIITMSVMPSPLANAGNDAAICSGSSAQLNGSGGTAYSWTPATGLSNPNIANPIANPLSTTVYVLTVTNANNCFGKDSVVITVNPVVTASVFISTTANPVCFGNVATFTASAVNGGSNPVYQWQVNGINTGTGTNIFTSTSLNNNDQVKTLLTSNAACPSTATVSSNLITMSIYQLAVPLVSLSNRVYTVTNPDTGAIYTWQILTNNIWANVVPLANGITFTAPAAGEYRVMAIKGPCIKYSASQVTNRMLLPANNPFGIYLYPNPSNSIITIDSIKLSQNWETLDILNADGKHVLPTYNIKNQTKVSVNINSLKNGTYFIQLRKKDGEFTTIKFVKI